MDTKYFDSKQVERMIRKSYDKGYDAVYRLEPEQREIKKQALVARLLKVDRTLVNPEATIDLFADSVFELREKVAFLDDVFNFFLSLRIMSGTEPTDHDLVVFLKRKLHKLGLLEKDN